MKLKAAWRLALYQKPLANGLVQCLLCPHQCKLKEGQKGLCQVRVNEGGQLWASSYGWVTALALDPIEKKPLEHFCPGSMILSVGAWGCNLRCPFCQNNAIAHAWVPGQVLLPDALANQAVGLKHRGNIGLAYTYNEPLVGMEFVLDTAKAIHQKGMVNAVVTNGYINPGPLQDLLPYVDALNIDLKSFNKNFYEETLGGDLEAVLRTIETCVSAGKHVEISHLVLSGYNDDLEECDAMCRWLADLSPEIPLHLARSFPRYRWKDLEVTSYKTLRDMEALARTYLHKVSIGNV